MHTPFLTAVVTALLLCPGVTLAQGKRSISKVAFGSCAHQDQPQPIWDAVGQAKPDVFLLIGDNIYGDSDNIEVLRRKYAQFAAVPGFARLRKEIPFLATWDDHDFGRNDAGVEFPIKRESQQLFLDFFNVPADSPRRKREGVYHAKVFGPEGKRVQIILLDTRYFRSPLKMTDGKRPYVPNEDPDATMLGEAQWRWLEDRLREPAELRLVVSSVQVVSQDHGGEKWMNFPRERDRLYALIRDTRANGVVFLSGDRHFADLSVIDGKVGYPLFDLTSSGLTQGARQWRPLSANSQRVAGMSFDNNFGLIAVDWEKADPVVSLQIRDVDGDIRINQKLPLSLLRAAPAAARP